MAIEVVGAVIVRDGRVLCARRGPGGDAAGRWEFPGGKVEPGESESEALARELREELCCEVRVGSCVEKTVHDYDSVTIRLSTYYCELVAGEPQRTEHAELRWVPCTDLMSLDWALADVPAVHAVMRDAGATHAPTIPAVRSTP